MFRYDVKIFVDFYLFISFLVDNMIGMYFLKLYYRFIFFSYKINLNCIIGEKDKKYECSKEYCYGKIMYFIVFGLKRIKRYMK